MAPRRRTSRGNTPQPVAIKVESSPPPYVEDDEEAEQSEEEAPCSCDECPIDVGIKPEDDEEIKHEEVEDEEPLLQLTTKINFARNEVILQERPRIDFSHLFNENPRIKVETPPQTTTENPKVKSETPPPLLNFNWTPTPEEEQEFLQHELLVRRSAMFHRWRADMQLLLEMPMKFRAMTLAGEEERRRASGCARRLKAVQRKQDRAFDRLQKQCDDLWRLIWELEEDFVSRRIEDDFPY